MFQLGNAVVEGVKGRAAKQSAVMVLVAIVVIVLLAGLTIVGKSRAGSQDGSPEAAAVSLRSDPGPAQARD